MKDEKTIPTPVSPSVVYAQSHEHCAGNSRLVLKTVAQERESSDVPMGLATTPGNSVSCERQKGNKIRRGNGCLGQEVRCHGGRQRQEDLARRFR